MRRLLLLLAVCACAYGQTPELAGVVIDAKGEPVRRAELTLTPLRPDRPGEFQQSLGNYGEEDGTFEFYGVPTGSYKLTARKSGFLEGLFGASNPDSSGAPIYVREGQPLTGLQITLTPQSVVSGRVATSDGSSPGMITVVLLRKGFVNGFPSLVHAGVARTTRAGDFRIAKLHGGIYYLIAEPQQRQFGAATGVETDQPTYFPGTNRFSDAESIEIATGETVEGLYLPMRRSPSFTVRGTVRGAGTDLKGINISLRADTTVLGANSNNGATTTDESGAFEIANVLPGPAWIYAFQRGETPLAGRAALNVNSDVAGVVIDLQAPFEVRGTIALEDGLAVPRLYVSLMRTNGQPASGARPSNGELHFQNVLPDEYRLAFGEVPVGGFVKSATFGEVDVLDSSFELNADNSSTELRIELGLASGQVVGFVQDEEGLPQRAVLTLIPDPPQPLQSWRYFVTDALANGAYRFLGVPPGKYLLQAWDSLAQDGQFDPDLTQRHAAGGVAVEMGPDETVQVNAAKITVEE